MEAPESLIVQLIEDGQLNPVDCILAQIKMRKEAAIEHGQAVYMIREMRERLRTVANALESLGGAAGVHEVSEARKLLGIVETFLKTIKKRGA